jgi:hypothetical protein
MSSMGTIYLPAYLLSPFGGFSQRFRILGKGFSEEAAQGTLKQPRRK